MRSPDSRVADIPTMHRVHRALLSALCAVVLTGCGISGGIPPAPKPPQDAAPSNTADVLQRLQRLPDPVVQAKPRSKRGNGPVYEVWGKSYRVMDSAAGFWQEGTASW